jgi:hypothetical protein
MEYSFFTTEDPKDTEGVLRFLVWFFTEFRE